MESIPSWVFDFESSSHLRCSHVPLRSFVPAQVVSSSPSKYKMKSLILLSTAIALGLASAQDIGTGDYPPACQQYCGPVAARSSACDSNNNNGDDDDDDNSEVNCICNGNGMSTAIPRCEACVIPFRIPGEDDYDDISDLVRACGLSPTSITGAPTPTTTYVFTTTSTDDVSWTI